MSETAAARKFRTACRSPDVVQYRPNTGQNLVAGLTRDQHETTTIDEPRTGLQNLHPRFDSGRRLQLFPTISRVAETAASLLPPIGNLSVTYAGKEGVRLMEIRIDPREFISPPFGQSPRSGKQEFGVPTVAGDTYWRRNRECRYAEGTALWPLRRKVLAVRSDRARLQARHRERTTSATTGQPRRSPVQFQCGRTG